MVESLQRQITQLKEDVRAKEIQVDAIQKRQMEDEREKDFQLREERSRAQKEIDKFEKQVRELNLQLNTERQNS
jgi:chromosome segregation ATPase